MGETAVRRAKTKTFVLMWMGETISQFGTVLSSFALGVWLFQQTGSVSRFALLNLLTILPKVLLLPLAGVLIDRFNRKTAMILGDVGCATCSALLALLLWQGNPHPGLIYLLVGTSSLFSAFNQPAMMASMTLLLNEDQLGRGNGLVQLSFGLAHVAAPILGSALLGSIGLKGVIAIDLATFMIGLCCLLPLTLPRPKLVAHEHKLLRETVEGLVFIRRYRGLWASMLLFAGSSFFRSSVVLLMTPLVLSFANPTVLGHILTFAASGFLFSSLLLVALGVPKRGRMKLIFTVMVVQALLLGFAVLPPSAFLLGALSWIYLIGDPLARATNQAIWQTKVPSHVQGRVFSFQQMAMALAVPAAAVMGPLADYVFEPAMAVDGALAPWLGSLLGIGPGRGIALLLLAVGLFSLFLTLLASVYAPLRNLEASDFGDPPAGHQAPTSPTRVQSAPSF